MKFEFSRRAFEKHSNIKFHENPPGESRVDQCGQTDGRTDRLVEATSFSQIFRKRLKKQTEQLT